MIYLAIDLNSTLTKIGFSDNPQYREKQLKTGNPDLRVFFICLGGKELEKTLHNRYAEFQYDLEWFSLPKNIIDEIVLEFIHLAIFFDKSILDTIQIVPQKYTPNLTECERELVEILENRTYKVSDLAKNLFIADNDIIKLLISLKKKKYLTYTKKGQTISISVNQAYGTS